MSSIISEVFYGSRQQKIIEEYLQRNENNPSEIQSKDQSYGQHFNLEFLITLPPILSVRSLLSVELGRHCIREEIDAY